MPYLWDTEALFQEIEADLERLNRLTARSLQELDADASCALSRWIGEWRWWDEATGERSSPHAG